MSDTGKRYEPSELLKNAFSEAEAKRLSAQTLDDTKQLADMFKADILGTELAKEKTTDENIEEITAKWNAKVMDILTSNKGNGVVKSVLTAGMIVALLPFTLGQTAGLLAEKPIMRPLKRRIRPDLLTASDYITAYYRQELDIKELKDKMASLGLPDEEQALLLRILESRPSAQDIITFAVREVYSPEIAARFGQFEGADAVYSNATDDIKAVGMSKETFSKYWAAHWSLPSTLQGYEMLHRGVITESDLDMLLRSADVMPFWRDKLKKISYSPLTRVDVRRMNKLGVLDRAGVKRAYKDIGYDEKNAELLTEFTIQYNASPEAVEETAYDTRKKYYQDLTRADILKNYRDSLLTRQNALNMLVSLGYDSSEADFLLDHEDYSLADGYRDNYTKYVKKLFVEGYIDKTGVTTELNKLGILSSAIDLYIKTWELDKDIRISSPSRADIMGFLKKKIITSDVAKDELKKLGYSERHIEWYLKALGEV